MSLEENYDVFRRRDEIGADGRGLHWLERASIGKQTDYFRRRLLIVILPVRAAWLELLQSNYGNTRNYRSRNG